MKKYKLEMMLDTIPTTWSKPIIVEAENKSEAMKKAYLLSIISESRETTKKIMDDELQGATEEEVDNWLCSLRCIFRTTELK